jgi:hypothetical protein
MSIPTHWCGSMILHIHTMNQWPTCISGTLHMTTIPVVGVNWKQAVAFSIWSTNLTEFTFGQQRTGFCTELPTAPGIGMGICSKRRHSPVECIPGEVPIHVIMEGCFLANFKPMRGNYTDDGWLYTAPVASFEPNDFGLVRYGWQRGRMD